MADNNAYIKLNGDSTGFVRAVRESEKAISGLSGELKGFEALAGRALSFAGIGLGTAEIINLADAYGQMTGKLKLATQYSGDYLEVQQMLRDSASQTRSDLPSTVNLYSQLSPALKGIGLSAKESVGLITTINQAISLSGVSSESAKAALVQLGQGFASGALRGEELNSIMEQTPALAQAIADGLGVSRGALREMGAEGKLTAEAVSQALQKVADQVADDFGKMPVTVGQALTNLRNEFLVFVGAVDSGSGGTTALAEGINAIATELKEAGPIVTAFTTALKTMMAGLDGSYRLIKILGIGVAGYGAAMVSALQGNLSQAKSILAEMGNDVQAVLDKKLIANPFEDKQMVEQTANTTRRRLQLETQLADEVKKLEQLKAVIAGESLDQIKAKEKENIDARVADQKRLVDAVRAAWQESLKAADTAAKEAQGLFDKATQKKGSNADKIFNAQTKGMSSEDQAMLAADRSRDLLGQGSYYAALAGNAQLDGKFKQAEQYQKQAEQFLARAETFADKAGDVALMEDVGNAQVAMIEAQAKAKQAEADKLTQQATAQAKTLNELQAQLDELQKKARAIELQVDVQKAESAIKGFKAELDSIQDKTVTLTLKTVSDNGVPVSADPGIPARAYGGPLPGHAPHDRADNMLYWGTPGEWVMQLPAVRYYGADFMRRLNAMKLPRHAYGGQLGAMDRLSVPSMAAAPGGKSSSNSVVNLTLDGKTFNMSASDDVAAALTEAVRREGMRKGFRR